MMWPFTKMKNAPTCADVRRKLRDRARYEVANNSYATRR